jgi:uncharacterized protein (DUF1697 family)
MLRYIALLRAINAGPSRTVKMESLRQLFESLGFSKVATFIASGNIVFEATTKNVRLLEKKIEKSLREALGYEVAVFIRSDAELAKIATYKPFPESKIAGAAEFNIVFLANTLDEKFKQKVMALTTDTNEFRVHDVRFTGCAAKSQVDRSFPRFLLRRRSGGWLPSAALIQSDSWP